MRSCVLKFSSIVVFLPRVLSASEQEDGVDGVLSVFETFKSIQGESSRAGRVCFFIRLSGCSLSCRWCDTPEARPFGSGYPAEISGLVAAAVDSGAGLVEVTGGEPLCQDATPDLCAQLLDAGLEVLVETNGAERISRLPDGVVRILDCKCPSSGEFDAMDSGNFDALRLGDEVKFAILDARDYDYAMRMINLHGLADRVGEISFSPVFSPGMEMSSAADLAGWMVRDNAPANLRLQLHKIIWPGGEPKCACHEKADG